MNIFLIYFYLFLQTGQEVSWDSSGGGFSNIFTRPPYQNNAVQNYFNVAKSRYLSCLKFPSFFPFLFSFFNIFSSLSLSFRFNRIPTSDCCQAYPDQ